MNCYHCGKQVGPHNNCCEDCFAKMKPPRWSNGYTKCMECGLPTALDCDLLCKRCENIMRERSAAKNSPNISPEKTGSPGPDSDHYTVNGITPMEYVKAMGQNEYRGACILNIIKYVSRYPHKGSPMKDLQKAKWYVEQLIVAQEEIEAAEK